MEMILKNTNQIIKNEMVCAFETEDNVNFIVLTDNSKNESGLLNIDAYYYEENNNVLYLTPIKNEDLHLVEEAINKLKNKGENLWAILIKE